MTTTTIASSTVSPTAFARGALLRRLALVTLATAAAAGSLSGCIPLVVGGAAMAGGAMVVADRRTSGTQLEDEGIELRASSRIREAVGERARVNVTSYNRQVLVTGEVPTEADKERVQQIMGQVENVRSVVNELAVMPSVSLQQRSSDTLVTGKVKASLIDAKDIPGNAFKVITERGTTYLMGRVSLREANRATDITRGVGGVQRVVRVFEILSEQEVQSIQTRMPGQQAR